MLRDVSRSGCVQVGLDTEYLQRDLRRSVFAVIGTRFAHCPNPMSKVTVLAWLSTLKASCLALMSVCSASWSMI